MVLPYLVVGAVAQPVKNWAAIARVLGSRPSAGKACEGVPAAG